MTNRSVMSPPLATIEAGLRRTTEALAAELAKPGGPLPAWNDLEWRLARAAAAAHGVAPLLSRRSAWRHPGWRRFLASQREHVEHRHYRIAALLEHIDAGARATGLAITALKGAALHAMDLYAPGDRPMADIDLLVCEGDAGRARKLLRDLGYVESFVQWKHRVFKPVGSSPVAGLGEHRNTPINIELHTRIQERLPVTAVDITGQIRPAAAQPGLNPYPSTGALMSHLLLHAAGNICGRSLRLLHLHDLSLLAARMLPGDWERLQDTASGEAPWWALPPLHLTACYYPGAVPEYVIERVRRDCPLLLRAMTRRKTLTRVSCSNLWLHALPGLEWSRSPREAGRYLRNRFCPTEESIRERADMVRTQLWLQGQNWVTASHRRRILTRLTRPVPRMDTLYVVRAALESA